MPASRFERGDNSSKPYEKSETYLIGAVVAFSVLLRRDFIYLT